MTSESGTQLSSTGVQHARREFLRFLAFSPFFSVVSPLFGEELQIETPNLRSMYFISKNSSRRSFQKEFMTLLKAELMMEKRFKQTLMHSIDFKFAFAD